MRVNWTDNFEELFKTRGQQRFGIRLLALWKIQSGLSETAVCQLLGKTHKTIKMWRDLYEREGLDGLLKIGSGRGKKAKTSHLINLSADILELQAARLGGRVKCQDIVDLVAEKYDVQYSCSGMYHVLHRLGFSWITVRSKHPKQDPSAQEAFKKTSWNRSKKSFPKI